MTDDQRPAPAPLSGRDDPDAFELPASGEAGTVFSFSPGDTPTPAEPAPPSQPDAAPAQETPATPAEASAAAAEPLLDSSSPGAAEEADPSPAPWAAGFWKKRSKTQLAAKFFQKKFSERGTRHSAPAGRPQRDPFQRSTAGRRAEPGLLSTPPAAPPPPKDERFQSPEQCALRAAELSGGGEPIRVDALVAMTTEEMATAARSLGVQPGYPLHRRKLFLDILAAGAAAKRPLVDCGHVDLTPSGHAYVCHASSNYRVDGYASFVAPAIAVHYGLKRGQAVEVQVLPPEERDPAACALVVRSVMDRAPEEAARLPIFEDLTPYYPLRRAYLEVPSAELNKDVSMRAVDILTPVGFGQRGLIVAPPRVGKTVLLQNIANSIAKNAPDAHLIVLLVDERPEEVTDFRRHVRGEVVASTFDESPESHVHLAEMVGEKARRLVETGAHVVILLDSITRLARAYNALAASSGKIMSGGVEATALQRPKRFFGAARNIEGGGSLTILGTALVETNSKMDEVIFEEFKGTGNMELHLDRSLSDKRIFPAINIEKSGTRKEELIYHPEELTRIYALRRAMQGVPPSDSMEMLIQRLKKTRSNAEFLMTLNR